MGIKIITSENIKLPTIHENNDVRLDLIFKQDKMKYIYTNSEFDEILIAKAIKSGVLRLEEARLFQFKHNAYQNIINGSFYPYDPKINLEDQINQSN